MAAINDQLYLNGKGNFNDAEPYWVNDMSHYLLSLVKFKRGESMKLYVSGEYENVNMSLYGFTEKNVRLVKDYEE